MTGEFLLDWAVMAVSLFNTVLLLWLGLTVLLNAERHSRGVWVAGGGLLTGGAFFISHSAILGHGFQVMTQGLDFWWHVGWGPVIALPFVWYMVMLWYAGFWDSPHTHLHHRHRPWVVFTMVVTVALVGLLIFANPLPSYWQVAQLQLSATPSMGGIPLLMLAYPFYIVFCICLSLDVLRHPGPSGRVMGDLARRRARPWLVAASVALLLVSLLVAWVMVDIIFVALQRAPYNLDAALAILVGWFDLGIASLIALAVILLGQAVVSYEVFTGKILPRRGFRRYWLNAVVLSAGYGVVIGWSFTIQLRPIYSLLLSAILVAAFYALLVWRSFAERERSITHLRPFVASQRLYERLVSPSAPLEVDVVSPFHALCADVLGARVAFLAALGPLAPLVGAPLVYPPERPISLPALSEIAAQFSSPQTMCVSVDPARHGDALWAIPLWSERGLIGVLLLGAKRDGGLYTQEEIEIARASGERLVDMQASAEMSRRLMALQRQRMAESQVLDRQARRALHDDVLPRLHAAMLALSSQQGDPSQSTPSAMEQLANVHRQISNLLRAMPTTTAPEVTRLGLIDALRQTVDEELVGAFDGVTWQIAPEAQHQARAIPSLTAEVLFYAAREAIRNAARHGRGSATARPLHLRVVAGWRDGLELIVEDDGVGLQGERSSDAGGQGLALHSTMMAVVGGTLAVESVPDVYTRVALMLPLPHNHPNG